MKKWLHCELPRILADLSQADFMVAPLPPATGKKRDKHAKHPVPIPFYVEPSPHTHDHVEIALVLEGPVYVETEGQGGPVAKSAVLVFPPNVRHYDSYVAPSTAYTVAWYVLWPGKPRMNVSRYRPKSGFELFYVAELDPVLIPADDWAFVKTFARGVRPELSRTKELLHALYAATLEAARRSGPMQQKDAVRKVVRDAVEYLERRLSDAPTVEMAAAFVGLSPTYLTTIVREQLGKPLHDVLAELRLAKAKELLASSTHSVKEIAHLSGFSTADYFSRTFRRMTGMPPGRFRERHAR